MSQEEMWVWYVCKFQEDIKSAMNVEYSERQSCVTSTQFSGSLAYNDKMEVDKPLYISIVKIEP